MIFLNIFNGFQMFQMLSEEEMLRRALAESCREAGMVDYEAFSKV